MAQVQITFDPSTEGPELISTLELLIKLKEAKLDSASPINESDKSETAGPEKKAAAKKSGAKEKKTSAKDSTDFPPDFPPSEAAAESKPETAAEAKAESKESAITLTDVRAVALKLSKAGKQKVLKEIFAKYDAEKLSDISAENYESLMADLEAEANG